jgi:hypothetical protein
MLTAASLIHQFYLLTDPFCLEPGDLNFPLLLPVILYIFYSIIIIKNIIL